MSDQADAPRRYLLAYRRIAPLSLALWRAAEASAVALVSLPRPLLDLGCGFGESGSAFCGPTDVCLDIKWADLRVARERGPYRHLIQADGRRLPFRDGGCFLARGRRVWRPPGVIWLWDRLRGGLVEEDKEVGCSFFLAAEKP